MRPEASGRSCEGHAHGCEMHTKGELYLVEILCTGARTFTAQQRERALDHRLVPTVHIKCVPEEMIQRVS